jgi:hypothetical protein
MHREQFMQRLAELIRPRSAQQGATILVKMLPFLTDLRDDLFTEESLAFTVKRGLPRAPSIVQVREAFDAYDAMLKVPATRPSPPTDHGRDAWRERQQFLHRDWDDPIGIGRKVHQCRDHQPLLRCLAGLVARWAPQHLGLVPPNILAAVAVGSDIPALVDIRRALGELRANDDAIVEPPRPIARPLTAVQLDAVNPLPEGRKRDAR